MFGEYLIYSNGKPAVLVCDNTAFIKKLDCVRPLLEKVETGFPYKTTEEHYIVDIEGSEFLSEVVNILQRNITLLKKIVKK
jgi:hypothetical protein